MNKQFENELIELARKYGLTYSSSCLQCGSSRETYDLHLGDSFMVTFTEIVDTKAKTVVKKNV